MPDKPADAPYGSACDLPTAVELEKQIAAFEAFRFLLPRKKRDELKEIRAEYERITSTVDRFYELLGDRHWVYTDDLQLTEMATVIDVEEAETAERRLIQYYRSPNRIRFPLHRLNRFPEIRPRMHLLEKALNDYEEERFYSAILVLLTVMDGFVNDLNPTNRKGLHAYRPEQIHAWDSVVGHHLGLCHAHKSFVKGYYKTDTNELSDLARNGILHGMLTNYDNEVVATKAWNRLFAVSDWAESLKRKDLPPEQPPTGREVLKSVWQRALSRTRTGPWEPHEHSGPNAAEESPEIFAACSDFLERWQDRQWGPLSEYFPRFSSLDEPYGKRAKEAKELYREYVLEHWEILEIRHTAPAIAIIDVSLKVNGRHYLTEFRWCRHDANNDPVSEDAPGRWVLVLYGPVHFLRSESFVE